MFGRSRVLIRWCWWWSAHPLVFLLALVMLVAQTRHLGRYDFDPGNESGARRAMGLWDDARAYVLGEYEKYVVRSYPPLPRSAYQRLSRVAHTRYRFAWDPDERWYVALPDHLWDRSMVLLGTIKIQDERAFTRRGVWAPTRLECGILYSFELMNDFEHEPALRLVSEAYGEHGKRYVDEIQSAILNKDPSITKVLYSGYAHNAVAIVLLGFTLLGLFSSPRWWRALRARLRSRKNRCVACGYALAGPEVGTCPECGRSECC